MSQKKYKVITKIANNPNGTAKCVKYNCSDLISYCEFLDKKFPEWTWSNVFCKESKSRLGSFTKYSRPTKKRPY